MSKHLAPRTCVLAHTVDPDRPRPAHHGYLCTGHYLDLQQCIAEMPALAGEVEPSLIHASMGAGPKVGGTREEPIPFDDIVSRALRGARDRLASWSAEVVERHPGRLHAPRFGMFPVCTFLVCHIGWVADQEWVSDFAAEVFDCRRQLRSALDTRRAKRVDLGPCDETVSCDLETRLEVTCTGIMRAVVHASDEELPAEISCTVCGTAKQPSEWRALARRLRQDREPMLTAAQISHLFRIPIGTVHWWASEDKWRRDEKRPRNYHSDDAQTSFDRRHIIEEAS